MRKGQDNGIKIKYNDNMKEGYNNNTVSHAESAGNTRQ